MGESFVFYRSFLDAANKIPYKYQSVFYKSIILYGLDGIEPDFSKSPEAVRQLMEMGMIVIRPIIDATIHKREVNSANGKKGGAPKGNRNAKKQKKTTENNRETTENKPEQAKTTENKPNVNVNDNGNANANFPLSLTNVNNNGASPPAEVGVSTSTASKQYGGLTEEEYERAKKLMPIYE